MTDIIIRNTYSLKTGIRILVFCIWNYMSKKGIMYKILWIVFIIQNLLLVFLIKMTGYEMSFRPSLSPEIDKKHYD